MKTFKFLTLIVSAVLFCSMVPHVIAATTLADSINSVLSSTSWSGSPDTISVGTIFGRTTTSAFDSASVADAVHWGWVKEIAAEDGYSSQAIDSHLSGISMAGALPATYNDQWLVYDRYLVPLYGWWGGWSKSAAISQIQADLRASGGVPYLAFGQNGGWLYGGGQRYYDEYMEDLDILLKLGDTASAATLWDADNAGNWQGTYYAYRVGAASNMECEVGFFAAVVANYKETVGTIPNFDRVSTDLYTKLLASGWSSPLWGAPSQMQHATSNSQLRLENTVAGIEALQMFYTVSNSAYRSAFVSLLTGGTPAWQYLMNAGGWGTSGVDDGAMKAALLFLYGVIPDSGSLAVPTNEWRYEDWTSMMPSTLFRFDYAGHTIQIPVNAGNIKFDFGSSLASYNFPQNGVYQVQFSSDWNSVTSANLLEGLTRFHFLSGGSSIPPSGSGSIKVTGVTGDALPVAFEAWYDSSSHVTVTQSGTYTFTNVPSGSHTVYGLYNGIQKSASVTVSQGQTASCTLDFSSSEQPPRPSWWPEPLPWPLPGYLSTIVSTPVYMFAGAVGGVAIIVGAASKFMKPKAKAKKDFSVSERR